MTQGIEVEAATGAGVELVLELRTAEEAVRYVLSEEGVQAAEVSLAFLSDVEIARLNQEYLGHEGTTDVISFPLHGPGEPPLGDVYVGAEQAERQAAELGVPTKEELLRLAIHGTLHVLGYDHPPGIDRDSTEMYQRQEALLLSFLDRIRAAER